MPDPTDQPPVVPRDRLLIGGYAAAGLVVIGSLGPWSSVLGISVAGTEGDGVITIALALLSAAGIYLTTSSDGEPPIKAHWVTVALASLCLLIAVVDVVDVAATEEVSPGWGLWLLLLSSIALVLVSVRLLQRLRSARDR